MSRRKGYVFVWPISTRIIHWMFAFSFTAAFISSFYEHKLHSHVAFGFIFTIMIIYRIVWGFVGPRYATFNTFKLSLPELKHYFVEKIRNRWRKIPAGHNPASSWYTVWALAVGSVISISGLLLYGIQEAKGIFRSLNNDYTQYIFILDSIHKYASYLFVAWALIHIVGVLIEQFWHKTNMVFAMISGYKRTDGEDTEVKQWLSALAFATIFLGAASYFFIVSSDYNFLTLKKYHDADYRSEYPLFYHECSQCHKVYPPHLLPEASWKRIMMSLDNHRGERITEANISKPAQKAILQYLIANSAEHSTREESVKMMHSLGKRRPKAITKTPYWRETHKHIPAADFRSEKIKDKSNCAACHKNFEHGILDDMLIIYQYN